MDKREETSGTFERATDMIERILKLLFFASAVLFLIVGAARLAIAETYTCAVHKGEWVWIRESPEPDARQIGRMRFGYEIESGEPINGFLAVDPLPGWMLDGELPRRGYVNAAYFDRRQPEKMMRVNTQGGPLAKRETPNGRLLCWIKPGVKISVLGWRYDQAGELWAKVYKGGYVKAEFLAEL